MKTIVDELEQKQSHILQGYNAWGYKNCTKCYSNYSLYYDTLQNKYKTPFKSYQLFHQVKLLNLKETCTFEGKMYYFYCKENGGHYNNKWRMYMPNKYNPILVDEHRKFQYRGSTYKTSNKKCTASSQTPSNQEDYSNYSNCNPNDLHSRKFK